MTATAVAACLVAIAGPLFGEFGCDLGPASPEVLVVAQGGDRSGAAAGAPGLTADGAVARVGHEPAWSQPARVEVPGQVGDIDPDGEPGLAVPEASAGQAVPMPTVGALGAGAVRVVASSYATPDSRAPPSA